MADEQGTGGTGNLVELPAGTVTFLFTDIEASTQLLKRLRERYEQALAEHDRILRRAIGDAGGRIVDTQGDAFFAAFPRAQAAIAAAVTAQRSLAETQWPENDSLQVRMGIHTGEPTVGRERYVGIGITRAARICAAAHGGQVLVSGATREICEDDLPSDVRLQHLGEHRLKDLDRPEHLYQLVIDGLAAEFPPPRTGEPGAAVTELADAVVGRNRRRALALGALVAVVATVVGLLALTGGESKAAGVAADSVAFVDGGNGRVGTQVHVDQQPNAVAVGEGAVWSASGAGTVTRLDPVTRTVRDAAIAVGDGPAGIAAGGGGVWVTDNLENKVSWINPQSNTEVRRIPVGAGPTAIAYGLGAVWVANSADRTLSRIDPSTGDVVKTIRTNAVGRGVAVGREYVWVTNEASGKLIQVDPHSNAVVGRVYVGQGPTGVAYGGGYVWVANSLDNTIARVDPETLTLRETIPLSGSPSALAYGSGSLWVATEFGQNLVRVDPRSRVVQETTPLRNRPVGIAAGDGGVWVAVQSGGAGHRGGRLVVIAHSVDTIDPQLANQPISSNVATTVYDGLTAVRRTGGSAGDQFIPDLAVALPQASDGGRTYTARLRRAIRYSDGRPVQAEDFRRAAERALVLDSPRVGGVVRALVGASRCTTGKRCDLRRGVIVQGSTVVFRLVRPNRRFIEGLAALYPIPPGTPDRDVGSRPVPSTGAYRIETYVPGKLVRLVRNRYFHAWSQAARPDGYPAEILWRTMDKTTQATTQAVHEVLQGRADLVFHAISVREIPSLAASKPRQLHSIRQQATVGVFFNVRRPPFDDVRVRRAFAYAVDRQHMADLHGKQLSEPTCQLVPPNVPGYARYCPYTIDPSSAENWTPNLPRARELIRRSGTAGQRVVVWTFRSYHAEGKYVVSLLRELGYEARLNYVADTGEYFGQIVARPDAQAGLLGWFGTTLAADMFSAFSCKQADWQSRFCDPRVDREVEALLNEQLADPKAAAAHAAQLDRELVDRAFWVPVLTPRWADLTSARVHNFQANASDGPLVDQMWVR